ncbi:MAG TPA: M23 family metallopeptidase [Saprospiraceae bacterium]|nr:M23 family metallopeptidase [Saprospiraceae bacterium]
MSKTKYIYNPATLQFEPLKTPFKKYIIRFTGFFSMLLFSTLCLYLLLDAYIPSPKEITLERELQQMQYYYAALTDDFDKLTKDLDEIQRKDAEVHRVVFGINPLDKGIWEGGIGGAERYRNFETFTESGAFISQSLQRVEVIKRKLEIQNTSLDSLYRMALDREEKFASIPSIKPIREDRLKRNISLLSGFGFRIHPVHKIKKFHAGIDFTAPRGTAIQATGNGVVKKVEYKKSGYGNSVLIDHGYGYTTLYAHMHTVEVKAGDHVLKGQKIGEVGSTGTSTAPHLHYEVRLNGKPVNPIDYCMDGLSLEEYKDLIAKASEENQSFD